MQMNSIKINCWPSPPVNVAKNLKASQKNLSNVLVRVRSIVNMPPCIVKRR